jgi:hypothetical protein
MSDGSFSFAAKSFQSLPAAGEQASLRNRKNEMEYFTCDDILTIAIHRHRRRECRTTSSGTGNADRWRHCAGLQFGSGLVRRYDVDNSDISFEKFTVPLEADRLKAWDILDHGPKTGHVETV